MKAILLAFLAFVFINGHAQTNIIAASTSGYSAPNATSITMNGIGDLKIGMKIAELEKLTGKLNLKNFRLKNGERDTVNFMYKESSAQVIVGEWYTEDGKTRMVVLEVKMADPLVKTRSGIGIGDDKVKIITTYDGYRIFIMPEYENDNTTKSKDKSTVWVHGDETGKVIRFYLTNNKVTAISVGYQEGC